MHSLFPSLAFLRWNDVFSSSSIDIISCVIHPKYNDAWVASKSQFFWLCWTDIWTVGNPHGALKSEHVKSGWWWQRHYNSKNSATSMSNKLCMLCSNLDKSGESYSRVTILFYFSAVQIRNACLLTRGENSLSVDGNVQRNDPVPLYLIFNREIFNQAINIFVGFMCHVLMEKDHKELFKNEKQAGFILLWV